MRKVFDVCAGIDVHKQSIVICLLKVGQDGKVSQEVQTFGTTTRALLEALDWLMAAHCQSVAMESTGVYWKPVFNLLESSMKVVLVNVQHVKALPGRKTGEQDSEWLAELHLHGLVRSSFIPPREIRELRDLVRTRTKLIGERARHVNRTQKVLEDANIKLGSMASDILGVSGRRMLNALVAGENDPTAVAGLTEEIEDRMRPFAETHDRLDAIPGIGPDVATVYISEMGVDSSRWPSYRHAASQAGLCPGHHESKRKSGRRRHGNRWIKQALVQAAWSAQRTAGTYMQAHFRRIRTRRGPKKSAVGVAHSLLVRCYVLVANGVEYKDLGPTYFDDHAKEVLTKRLVRRLKQLGYDVALTQAA